MAIYCWGNTENGELGLGGIEEEEIISPRKLNWTPLDSCVIQVSCGYSHTLFLTSSGKIFSCGSNDNCQLGHVLQTKRPRMSPFKQIVELEHYSIMRISCGESHSMALNEWGQIFAWGHNDSGQLGISNSSEALLKPTIVRSLVSTHVVQISCGIKHTLILTNCGKLHAWGSNIHGQLGETSLDQALFANAPRFISTLQGIPIAYITCGGNHSFAISKSGAVFGWGKNNCGQLGLNDNVDRFYPTQLRTLRSLGVRYIACGHEFSVFLTNDGGVFTCGSGRYGQLGHGSTANEVLPRQVLELMGSTVTQIACGSRHTLALVSPTLRIYGFGLGSSGQLGAHVITSCRLPQVILGPWISPSGQNLIESEGDGELDKSYTIKEIFSGGDQSIVTCTAFQEKLPATDYRTYDDKTQILSLTEELAKEISIVDRGRSVDMDLLSSVETIFCSQGCINGSFLLSDYRHFCCTSKHHGIDIKTAERAFGYLRGMRNETLKSVIWDKITNCLIQSLKVKPPDVESLRIYILLPFYHEFVNSKNCKNLHTPFALAVLSLSNIPQRIVATWWSEMPSDWFEQLVLNYKNVVPYAIGLEIKCFPISAIEKRMLVSDMNLMGALKILNSLNEINNNQRRDKVHYEIFHWPELTEFFDIQRDYIQMMCYHEPDSLKICYYPFLFNAEAKTTLLQTDQTIEMHIAMLPGTSTGYRNMRLGESFSQYVVLNVHRKNLVQDTIGEIARYSQCDLKKPLKVKFVGEEAEDAGGVRKEFFMLLLKDLFDPIYGMFKEYEDSRVVWFADVTFETETMYFLIGNICSLAIYNFTIINLPFPLALYKKLLGVRVDLSDLRDLSPTLANSMQQILDYDGDDFEETFDLHFEISREIFGELKSVPLKENGEDIAVTKETREEFVDLYVDFIFNKAVDDHFKAFQKGFLKICSERVLKLFRPEELMAMIVGNEDYNWIALEENCNYQNGYKSSDKTIRFFWEVFHNLSLVEKKKFLLFLTGTDRIPIQGMKAIIINIQPINDERFLPVAHTCFNLLDLPRYSTKERLKYKLLQAIQQTQGFSIV